MSTGSGSLSIFRGITVFAGASIAFAAVAAGDSHSITRRNGL